MTHDQNDHSPQDSLILAALPAEELGRLLPRLEEVEMRLGEVLYRPDEAIPYVYFPLRGSISVIAIMEDGSQVEVGVVGNEGMFGLPIVLGTDSAPFQAVAQIAGSALKMRADLFREEMDRGGRLRDLLLRYAQGFFVMTAQNAACNRRHHLGGRLARWLLMCRDRAKSDELEVTHEFLSVMLGVRRAGISVATSKLQELGLVRNERAHIRILDPEGLERYSCECYHVVRREFDRLLADVGEPALAVSF